MYPQQSIHLGRAAGVANAKGGLLSIRHPDDSLLNRVAHPNWLFQSIPHPRQGKRKRALWRPRIISDHPEDDWLCLKPAILKIIPTQLDPKHKKAATFQLNDSNLDWHADNRLRAHTSQNLPSNNFCSLREHERTLQNLKSFLAATDSSWSRILNYRGWSRNFQIPKPYISTFQSMKRRK